MENTNSFAILDTNDYKVLLNIAEKNNITVQQIIGLLLDGYLHNLVIKNNWECDYDLVNGSPWNNKK